MEKENKTEHQYTVAFYNVENLFDFEDNGLTHDNDFLPNSAKRWTKKRYKRKLHKLADVISKIGFNDIQKPPTLIGIAEAENKKVLKDLIDVDDLKGYNYDIVHYDSKDERGIDVGLIYNKDEFELINSKPFTIYLEKENGTQDFTRDILLVSGKLNGELIHCIVNHWPSRRDGLEVSSLNRIVASQVAINIIETIKADEVNPKIIVMGDFNDNPNNESVKMLAEKGQLFNPMKTLVSYSRGTQNHNFKWNVFDQILFTTNFFETDNLSLKFEEAGIYDEKFLTQYYGKFKGQPFRTYVGKKYKGGFSDHFPVYMHLSKMN
ncbi:endonuclease/exonuclease/phosphatase family protein [Psychroserpens ponticola]|uniref:Endonuclease n=1 Tax=Psychroserpens ponticola TaxID=2932268 RepID=A0ABY7RX67_9FLAO|nr:endonuclease [Psychroserpens ponticola]WCO01534.1 endonuclease [Psychroserpens ponticola]